MMEKVKRKIRRLVARIDARAARRTQPARAPEPPRPSGPERAAEPGPDDEYAVPVTNKERRHDGWSEIRPRRPGEDTDMGRDMVPDITDPGRDIDEERH